MKIFLCAVGKLRSGPFWELCEMYRKRLRWSFKLEEIEASGARSPSDQKRLETQALLAKIPASALPIFLDPGGEVLSSPDLALFLETLMVTSQMPAFVIGGAEGLERGLYPQRHKTLSLGAAIWPHLLARVMLMEQLYRAQEILGGTKYHR